MYSDPFLLYLYFGEMPGGAVAGLRVALTGVLAFLKLGCEVMPYTHGNLLGCCNESPI